MKSFKKLLSLVLSAVMVASVLPMSAMAAETTKAVKEDIDWENWLMPGAEWSSYLDGCTYYVEEKYDVNNDYGWWCGGANPWVLTINDVGHSDSANAIATKTRMWNPAINAGDNMDIPTSDGVLWGFKGSKYYTGWLADNSVRADFPADRWLGVKDISASEDTGYAVFTIDSVSGDAANAYLAIKVATDPWMIGLNGYEDLPVTKEKYSNMLDWKEPYMTFVLGVKLKDYYDVSRGGKQTVAVPLSKLTSSPDFKEMYSKATETAASTFADKIANSPIDLRLFTGMGIAKKDSGKKQGFQAVVSELAIVDPITPGNVGLDQDGETVILWFDETTDTDVTYKVKKTCNGVVEYIDAPECVIEDTIDTEKSYMYQVVAVDNTFGVESAPSEPVYIGAAGIEIEKDNMDWKNWVGEGDLNWMNYLEGASYYTGTLGEWNDYAGYQYCAGRNLNLVINDSNSGKDMSIAHQMLTSMPDMSTKAQIPTNDGFWGFVGTNYNHFRQMLPAGKDKIPSDKWLGVKDISNFKDGGFAVFTVESVTGDAENAYFAITSATDIWQLGLIGDVDTFPITKEKYGDRNWVDAHYVTAVNGAKLTDYYDVEKGGRQTVAIPLSKLVDEPDFFEYKAKDYARLAERTQSTDAFTADLRLFSGMGIARRDAMAKQEFAATISEMKIVALQLPENVAGKKNPDGSVTITFGTTNDLDVNFKVAKTVDGVTEYFDAPAGSYTDNNVNPKASTVYRAAAYNEEYDIYALSEDSFVSEPEYVSVVKTEMDWKNWVGEGDNSWMNYLEGEIYYTGDLLEWNDYYGYQYGAGRNLNFVINDSNSGKSMSIAHQMLTQTPNMSTAAAIPNMGGFWGYVGTNYNGYRQLSDKSKVPADRWLGVKDISAYENTGYAVFTVEAVEGDAENAYFAITSATDTWQLGLNGDVDTFPITKEKYGDRNWVEAHYLTAVNGVKLTDYYDISKGGRQTVAIPLSQLIYQADFFEFKSKEYAPLEKKIADVENFTADLRLFSGMGIARRDAMAKQEFSATISEMKIVAIEAPIGFDAYVNENGVIDFTFETTFDKGVAFRIMRVCEDDGDVVYFDAPNGKYTETNRDESKTYTYYAVAAYDQLGIETASDGITFESEVTSYIKLYANGEETKYVKAGTMSAAFFTTKADATGYIAKYDAEGRLTGANLTFVPAGEEKTASLEGVEAGDTVKAMFWADGEPVVDAIVAEEKPLTILVLGDEGALNVSQYVEYFIYDDVMVEEYWNWDADLAEYAGDIENILADDEWDYILMQEDMDAVLEGTAYDGYAEIAAAIAEYEPNAKVFVTDGWCYSPIAAPDGDPDTMFAYVTDVPGYVSESAQVVSTATAIYLAAFDMGLDVWAEDGMGLSDTGSYLTSLLLYKAMTGIDVNDIEYAPEGVDAELIKELASSLEV